MQLTKCDKCHREIKHYRDEVTIRTHDTVEYLSPVELHRSCAKPVMDFLKRNNFLKPEKPKG